MVRSCAAFLAILAAGCRTGAPRVEQQANVDPLVRTVDVAPEKAGPVLEDARERAWKAARILYDRLSCSMPADLRRWPETRAAAGRRPAAPPLFPTSTLIVLDPSHWKGARSAKPVDDVPITVTGVSAEEAEAWRREWIDPFRTEPILEDYDFFGVVFEIAPAGDGIVITSLSGDVKGLGRVEGWVRRRTASQADTTR